MPRSDRINRIIRNLRMGTGSRPEGFGDREGIVNKKAARRETRPTSRQRTGRGFNRRDRRKDRGQRSDGRGGRRSASVPTKREGATASGWHTSLAPGSSGDSPHQLHGSGLERLKKNRGHATTKKLGQSGSSALPNRGRAALRPLAAGYNIT